LLNVCYKIITKVLTNRLASCINKVISDFQYGFIKGKYIIDGVVSLHEIIHEVKRKKQSGVIFKVDFEKAYDKVNWNFLHHMMIKKGFDDKWCDWVMRTVRGGKVAIKTNDRVGPYFITHKGVRQGDPFSPLLFNIAADGLACMVHKAKDEGIIRGFIPHIIPNGCCCLQYADDTIFLLQDDLEGARNLKFILCLFEQMSGLKINFHKSEIFCLGEAVDKEIWYGDIFTCPSNCLPMKYLGVPIDDKKLCKSLWLPIVEKVEKKMGAWQGKFLSLGGRLVLINSSLTNVPLYMLSMYKAPKNIVKKMDLFRKRLLWQGGHAKKKYHLADWNMVCSPRGHGGLGVLDLHKMNEALLAKWLWKLENTNGLWQTIIRHKYVKGRPIISLKKRQSDSHFWKGILDIRDNFYKYCKNKVGNGSNTSFWHNIWCDLEPLSSKYASLFDIAYDKDITVEKAFSSAFRAVNFRRRIYGALEVDYNNLITQCNNTDISEEDDKSVWLLGNKGFSVNSFYKEIKCSQIPLSSSFLWKTRLPHKIKAFLWLVMHKKILTKDNLFKKSGRAIWTLPFVDFQNP
jgi:hypothetical protein